MKSLLLNETSPLYLYISKMVNETETREDCRILFVGLCSSRSMGIYNKTSDYDCCAVFETCQKQIRKPYEIEICNSYCGCDTDFIMMDIKLIRERYGKHRTHGRYPTYHYRTDTEREREIKIPLQANPYEFIMDVIFNQHIWDDRGDLRELWAEIRENHLSALRMANMYYSYAHGSFDNNFTAQSVSAKKYLGVIHRSLSIRYILETNQLPPIDLEHLLKTCRDSVLKDEVSKLLFWYREKDIDKEAIIVSKNAIIDDYLKMEFPILRKGIERLSIADPERLLDIKYPDNHRELFEE